MPSPFDNDEQDFIVLLNSEGQHSLWPSYSEIPAGWKGVFGPRKKAECIAYIEANWPNIMPLSIKR